MVAANDMRQRREEIWTLFAADNISQAIKRLMDFTRDFSSENSDYVREVIVLSANFTRLEKVERRGTLSFKELEQERTRLLYQALGLMDGVQNDAGLIVS